MNRAERYPAFVFWSHEDGAFLASSMQLDGCIAHGEQAKFTHSAKDVFFYGLVEIFFAGVLELAEVMNPAI